MPPAPGDCHESEMDRLSLDLLSGWRCQCLQAYEDIEGLPGQRIARGSGTENDLGLIHDKSSFGGLNGSGRGGRRQQEADCGLIPVLKVLAFP
jgi:hypothetical protein